MPDNKSFWGGEKKWTKTSQRRYRLRNPQDVDWNGRRPQVSPEPVPTSQRLSKERQMTLSVLEYYKFEGSEEHIQLVMEQKIRDLLR